MSTNHTDPDPATAQSSRLFVKNLPPNITEADFLKHFSAQGRPVTDVKLIPHRRIGFVGYKSHDDAARAVKYFHRSFIRMSRINCDLAKPIEDSVLKRVTKDSSRPSGAGAATPVPVAAVPKPDPSANKRKRDSLDEADPKLQEFLEVMGHPTKKSRDSKDGLPSDVAPHVPAVPAVLGDEESDDEYETIPARSSKPLPKDAVVGGAGGDPPLPVPVLPAVPTPVETVGDAPQVAPDATDDDWLRSRTNRLLDLVDPNDPGFALRPAAGVSAVPASTHHPPTSVEQEQSAPAPPAGTSGDAPKASQKGRDPLEQIAETSRLFLRNLSYHATEDDIRDHFSAFGELVEVNLPRDKEGKVKGFAMIQYGEPSSAVAAFQADGSTFQGRIIHILPAAAKRSTLDEYALSQMPLKKQQLLRKKAEAASTRFNWNSLFMSQDAVNTAVAERLGVSKHEMLDPTDASAAVKQAVAETTVIKEAKAYFAANGVNIEAFKSQERGDTTILVKNIANTTIEELRQLFEEHGTVLRVLMPPSGTIAIVQFAQPAQCRVAFAKKAYSRCKASILFLEKGPKGLLTDVAPPSDRPSGLQKATAAELLERDDAEDQPETSSLFVRNLNFSTTTDDLTKAFQHLAGFVKAQVKTKTDPKKPGQILSMGFGFCAFRTKELAQAAQKAMDGFVLAAHKLSVKASHRGLDAAEEQRQKDLAKKAAGQRTKLIIKNLPFEMSKKEVRELFSNYGKLISIRIPKKFDQSSRGFAFAEFSTPKEALNAMTALKDTHLLGRRLVIEFSEADEVDPEEQIKAMEKKMRGQANKVALQQLTGRNRSKVNIGNDDEDEA
ncbi:putative multiple RNA-binding domain-containing protein [Podospora conica]|nr:putative multiple RNA-binding domain-containing protein [Schizothecium conicum]